MNEVPFIEGALPNSCQVSLVHHLITKMNKYTTFDGCAALLETPCHLICVVYKTLSFFLYGKTITILANEIRFPVNVAPRDMGL